MTWCAASCQQVQALINVLCGTVLQFSPIIECPPDAPLTRYGGLGDGYKLLCNLGALKSPCSIYSLGAQQPVCLSSALDPVGMHACHAVAQGMVATQTLSRPC